MKESAITKLYITDKIHFDFDPTVPCFIDEKVGVLLSEEFTLGMEGGLELFKEKIKEYPAIGWIANLSKANVFGPEDSKWVIEHWTPAAVAAGLKYVAYIEPESDFAKEKLTRYIQEPGLYRGMIVNSFRDIEMAKNWLRSQL